jgi:exodeoxyribonuclease-1
MSRAGHDGDRSSSSDAQVRAPGIVNTLFWYDYETFGIDTRRDRIAQFAGVRTDEQLQVVDDEVMAHCRIPDDYLPDPRACLVTGIVPQATLRDGMPEAQFARCVHQELAKPGTCGVGYNSLRFDDEFTRFLLYRNFFDAYAREWRNGNSRWDLIDAMRLAHALRPQGIEWPVHEDGTASFRLEDLTSANGLEHSDAHDALSDVRATLATAQLLRAHHPRLYDYVYRHRDRRSVAKLLDTNARQTVLHVSSKYPARLGCIALVAPLCCPPANNREVVVFDLRQDPQILLALPAEEIARRVFTRDEELDDERIALKTVRLNRAPVVVPANTLTPEAAERWSIDPVRAQQYLALIDAHGDDIAAKLADVFQPPDRDSPSADPETALYESFVEDGDRELLPSVQAAASVTEFTDIAARFADKRLREMLFNYRARNLPEMLSEQEHRQWHDHRRSRLLGGASGSRSLRQFRDTIESQQAREELTAQDRGVLAQLTEYANSVEQSLA